MFSQSHGVHVSSRLFLGTKTRGVLLRAAVLLLLSEILSNPGTGRLFKKTAVPCKRRDSP